MKKSFPFYADPGHGWAAVPFTSLAAIGLTTGDFSGYSYVRGETIYLEEDGDLSFFIETFRAKTGEEPAFPARHANRRSQIRGYASNRPGDSYRARNGL